MAEKTPSPPHPSQQSLRRLDWFVFLVADVQTGFGPFVSVYLTSEHWTMVDIGLIRVGHQRAATRRQALRRKAVPCSW